MKRLTPEIKNFLATLMPLEIPSNLAAKARSLRIDEIYYLRNLNLSEYGLYGNHIVIVDDSQYMDFDISPINSVRAIIELLY